MGVAIAHLFFVSMGLTVARYGVNFIRTPAFILGPLIIGSAVIGSYALNISLIDVWIMMAKGELARSLALVQGRVPALTGNMFTRPISLLFMSLIAISVFQGVRSYIRHRHRGA